MKLKEMSSSIEQAKLVQELAKLQDIIRNQVGSTESVHENDKIVKEALELAREINKHLAQAIVIKDDMSTDQSRTFVLGRPSAHAAQRLRSERIETAFRALLNQRFKIIKIHKQYEGRIDEMQKSLQRVSAINPKLAEQLKLKVKIEAAKFANSLSAKIARGTVGSGFLGSVAATVLSIAGNPLDKNKPETKEEDKFLAKLNAEEERCASLYSNKNAFQECLMNFMKLLMQHPNFKDIPNIQDTSLKAQTLSQYERARDEFLSRMLEHSKQQIQMETKNKKALQEAVSKFEESLKGLKTESENLIQTINQN